MFLIETDWLEKNLNNVKIIDCSWHMPQAKRNGYEEYKRNHIPRSIFIGLDGGFAPWVGTLLKDVKQKILLVVQKGREKEAITRLSRVGFDQTIGFLKDGFSSWIESGKEIDSLTSISAEQFERQIRNKDSFIYDVRKVSEYETSRINSSVNTPLGEINNYLNDFPENKDFYIHCAGGYRSVIAASILKSRGIHNIIDVKGGFQSIMKTDISLT